MATHDAYSYAAIGRHSLTEGGGGGSYPACAIASVTPTTQITAGGGEGVIAGVNFAASGNTVTIDGNACDIVSESTTEIRFTFPADDAGSYTLQVTEPTNGTTDTATVTYADPGTPILTSAEAAMVTLIEGMTEAAGYHNDWGTADQQDRANMTYPAAFCELLPDEANEDDPDGAHASAYLNRAEFRVRVWVEQSLAENPVTAVNAEYNKCLDDLKKVFGTGAGSTLSGTVQHIQYLRSERINQESGDVETPGYMDTYWSVLYHQDRTYPSINA